MMTALTTSSQQPSTSDQYIPRTDQAEVQRLRDQYAGQGLGDTIYGETDEEMMGFMSDMMGVVPENIERKE